MILAPFKWIVALFFNWSYALFHDPGWAVVGMSVLLSLLLTPLYIWIERRKNADKAKGAPMQAEIDKIEAVYSGRERFYYTREIQRRYGYSPWTAMIPTLGLLVQIPFLLAAYHYLSELPLFDGVAFWYIKDLSKPDTIATVAGLPINLLAILMTVINLVSGWRYAESGKPKERIQYMAVAAIFLFLLYNCAASVVLYWTLSNALSFVRSEIFFRQKGAESKQAFVLSAEKVITLAKWLCIYLITFAVILAIDVELLQKAQIQDKVVCALRIYSFITVSIFSAAAVLIATVIWRFKNGAKLPYTFKIILGSAMFVLVVPFMHRFAGLPVEDSRLIDYWADMGVPIVSIMFILLVAVSWPTAFPERNAKDDAPWGPNLWIVFWIAVSASLQFFLCGPICAFASCPEGAGDATLQSLILQGVSQTAVLMLMICGGIKLLPKSIANVFVVVLLLAFTVFFVNGNIIPRDYGVLFQGRYSNAENINPKVSELLIEAALVSLISFLSIAITCLIRKSPRTIVVVLVLISTSFVFRIVMALVKMPRLETAEVVENSGKKLFQFSRTAKNTVFLLMDSYVGQRFGVILDSDPKLKEVFDGFTWYPNTISASTYTFPDMPAVWSGEKYFPWWIDKSRKLEAVYWEAWNLFENRVKDAGYRFSSSRVDAGYGCKVTKAERMFQEMDYKSVRSRVNSSGHVNLASLKGNAFMWAMPLAVRPHIYDSGHWHVKNDPFDPPFNFMEELIDNSEVIDSPKGVFINIHSEATHAPFLTRVNGVNKTLGIDNCFKWSTERVAEWLEWMKKNGVYENSRIILLSDHGSIMNGSAKHYLDQRYVMNVDKMRDVAGNMHQFFALLAIKDYSQHGSLKTDVTTKTISHGAYFAFDDPRFGEPVKEIVASYVSCPPDWRKKNGFVVLRSFRIVGDASDGNNWQKIEK